MCACSQDGSRVRTLYIQGVGRDDSTPSLAPSLVFRRSPPCLRPNARYFRLDDVSFERITLEKKPKVKKDKNTPPKAETQPEAGTPGDNQPGTSGGHVGV